MQSLSINIILNKKNIYRFFLIVVSVVVILAFLNATSYTQLAIATLFYPPLIYLALTLFPRKAPSITLKRSSVNPHPGSRPEGKPERETVEIADIDKRAFLKIIAGAGLSYFLYSIFTKRVQTLLPGGALQPETFGLQDATGKTIRPAESQLTDAYRITEIDDQGEVAYFGFIDIQGAWFIMKEENGSSFRYTRGKSNFVENWVNRKLLGYDYYHKVFP